MSFKLSTAVIIIVTLVAAISIYALLSHSAHPNRLANTKQAENVDENSKLVQILKNNNIAFVDEYIAIPSWVKHIKIDVGLSYNAPITQKWLEQEENLLVFAFEPNPWSVARIKDVNNAALAGHDKPLEHHYINDKVFIIPVALGSNYSTTDFYITDTDVGCSSLYRPKTSFSNVSNVIKVDVFRLSTFLKLIPWSQVQYIEYLKIDAQGHDLEIVKGLGDYISKIIYITLEAESNTYEGCKENNLKNMIAYMQSRNFAYIKHPNTSDPTFINNNYMHMSNVFIQQ